MYVWICICTSGCAALAGSEAGVKSGLESALVVAPLPQRCHSTGVEQLQPLEVEEKGGRVEMDFTWYKKEKKIRRIQNRSCMFSDSVRLCARLVFALFGHMHTLRLLHTCGSKKNPTEHHNPQKKGISGDFHTRDPSRMSVFPSL